jgi:hypothetical protein
MATPSERPSPPDEIAKQLQLMLVELIAMTHA